MNAQCKNYKKDTDKHQKIGEYGEYTCQIARKDCCAEEIQNKSHGNKNDWHQQENTVLSVTGGNVGVHGGKENQSDPEKPYNHAVGNILVNPDAGVECNHPDRNGSLIEHFLAI